MIQFKELTIKTTDNNLSKLDPKLADFVEQYDYYHMEDLTTLAQNFVKESQLKSGVFTAQVLHTTCVLSVNELNEPMLMGDVNNHMREFVPKVKDYLHNSKLRTANRCEDDHKCDRNADAHIKSFMIGNTSISLLVREGQLVLGQWQRLGMVDFDGPRTRKIVFQIMGE